MYLYVCVRELKVYYDLWCTYDENFANTLLTTKLHSHR